MCITFDLEINVKFALVPKSGPLVAKRHSLSPDLVEKQQICTPGLCNMHGMRGVIENTP